MIRSALTWIGGSSCRVAAAFLWQARQAAKWHDRATVAESSLASVRTAQAAADKAAKANVAAKAQQHATNNQETTDGLHQDLAAAGDVAAALRLRIADLERARRSKPLPGTGAGASGVDEEDDKRLSLTDELTLRNACESERLYRSRLIDWEAKRVEIEAAPAAAVK
jgi:hypothetical protein